MVSLVPTLYLRDATPGFNIAYAQFWLNCGPWQRHILRTLDGRLQNVEIGLSVAVLGSKHYLCVTLRTAPQADNGSRDLLRLYQRADAAPESCLVTDLEGAITYVNPAFEKVTGYRRSDLIGQSPRILRSGAHDAEFFGEMWATLRSSRRFHGVLVNRKRNGAHYHEEISIRPFIDSDGNVTHFVSSGRDVSERYQALQHLTDRANHDALTRLPNRHLFRDRMQQAMARANRHATRCCLLYLDLDRFKEINDRFGHAAGDRLLKAVAVELRQCLRDNDTVARLGGDEFAVILEDVDTIVSAERILHQIGEAVRRAVAVHGQGVPITASIGACLFPMDCDDEAWLMALADKAMYCAKTNGGNGYSFVADGTDATASRRIQHAQPVGMVDAIACPSTMYATVS